MLLLIQQKSILQTIIDALYGTDPESQQEEGTDARLLLPDDIADILKAQ
jgi:hypothetical protein